MSFLRASHPSIFPTYLFPSLPFRRRQSSTDSSTSTSSTTSVTPPDAASPPPPPYLSGHTSYLRCTRCAADLCATSQIISKGFTGRHGRAYLVSASTSAHSTSELDSSTSSLSPPSPSLPNTHTHKAVPRQLVTGAHTVSDVSCAFCGVVLGWKYVAAEEESQRYKVGKFILETKKVCEAVCWEGGRVEGPREADVEFDSQDEEECEDLFAGVWTPEGARRRRSGRRFRN